jgi:hypothetical protein
LWANTDISRTLCTKISRSLLLSGEINWAAKLVDMTVMRSSADGYLEVSGAAIARILHDLTVLAE